MAIALDSLGVSFLDIPIFFLRAWVHQLLRPNGRSAPLRASLWMKKVHPPPLFKFWAVVTVAYAFASTGTRTSKLGGACASVFAQMWVARYYAKRNYSLQW